MPLIDLIILFVVVGVILYLINAYVPMEPTVKKLLNIAVIIILVLLVIRATGLLNSLRGIEVGAAPPSAPTATVEALHAT